LRALTLLVFIGLLIEQPSAVHAATSAGSLWPGILYTGSKGLMLRFVWIDRFTVLVLQPSRSVKALGIA